MADAILTKERAMELYGEVPCKFSSYYKYTFTFSGMADDGAKIDLSVGGNHDDIYRYDVSPATVEKLSNDNWYSVSIRKDDQELFSEYRY